ncbi:MAG: hypothetical protein VX519_02415 [Myxococcota bacterium]|nr:hypothetical protein [Myxococcota bacterium]
MLLPTLLLMTTTAVAQEPADPWEAAGAATSSRAGEGDTGLRRNYLQQVNVRARYLSLPDGILDRWYFNDDTQTTTGPHPPRPKVRAQAVGLEYVLQRDEANGIFYFEYMPVLMEHGYWDDREQGGETPEYDDGDYVKPENFAIYTLGANYGFAVPANDWFSLIFGGGLGVSIRSGQLQYWGSTIAGVDGEENTWTAMQHYENEPNSPDGDYEEVPRVIPMVDVNLGVRFDLNETANIRVEGGFHGLFFLGLASGIVF